MQARLDLKRFPSMLVVIVFALVAALLLGGAVGYMLKPNSAAQGQLDHRPTTLPAYEYATPTLSKSGRSL